MPTYIRSDNGGELTAEAVRDWLFPRGRMFIEPGSPWENGYNESFNDKLRGELLNTEIFDTLQEAKILIEHWHRQHNTARPHSSLKNLPPSEFANRRRPTATAAPSLPAYAGVP